MDRLALSPAEVARALGVTRDTVLKWIRDGNMRAVRIGRRSYFIPTREIETLLSGREGATP